MVEYGGAVTRSQKRMHVFLWLCGLVTIPLALCMVELLLAKKALGTGKVTRRTTFEGIPLVTIHFQNSEHEIHVQEEQYSKLVPGTEVDILYSQGRLTNRLRDISLPPSA